MNGDNLTDQQKELLRKLVRCVEEGAEPPISVGFISGQRCIRFSDGTTLEHQQGDLIGDLDALCDADLMRVRYSEKGTKLYSIKQAGYDAVDNDFKAPPAPPEAQFNIGAFIQTMMGGSVQAIGTAQDAEISQVINDPALLRSQVKDLTDKLLDEVKAVLPGSDLIEYTQAIQGLKEELLAEKPTPSLLKRLTGTLAFLGDVEGTIGLMTRVWPYLYPLLLIAAERLG